MRIKIIVGFMVLLSWIFTGCSNTSEALENTDTFDELEELQETEYGDVVEVSDIAQSTEFLETAYTKRNGISYIANYDNLLYMTHSEVSEEQGIFCMEVGSDESKSFYDDFRNDGVPTVITTDMDGNVYTVVRLKQEHTTTSLKLLKISPLGELLYETEFIQYADEESSVWAIAVDVDGYVYVRTAILDDVLLQVFDSDGEYVGDISDEEGTYKLIDSLGRGPEGKVYAILTWGEEKECTDIFKMSGETLSMESEHISNMPSGVYYSAIGESRDGNFVTYNVNYGVQIVLGNGIEAKVVSDQVAGGVEGCKSCFLADGRLLLVRQETSFVEGKYQVIGSTLYYIPFSG
ncbi:MAG: hypothetical protein R3Y47_06245 [Lachnospiraceae bacterium]